MPSVLDAAAARIREQAAAYLEATRIPWYLAGVYHDGGQAVAAHGTANVVTGRRCGEDTGFLFGSVTKLLTTSLVLQQAERGTIDLDERVVRYLPEFTLATPSAAGHIRVRDLLMHTNGIDADLFFPEASPDTRASSWSPTTGPAGAQPDYRRTGGRMTRRDQPD